MVTHQQSRPATWLTPLAQVWRWFGYVVGCTLVFGIGVFSTMVTLNRGVRFDEPTFAAPPRLASTDLKLVTFNIAHGRGFGPSQIFVQNTVIASNLDAIARYLRWENADIVALQEVDESAIWSGSINQAALLAARAGYPHYRIGINSRLGFPFTTRYGNAILSRYPIRRFTQHPFGRTWLGQKGVLEAEVLIKDRPVLVLVAHLHHRKQKAREAQAERILALVQARVATMPVVLLGDLNVAPTYKERTLQILTDKKLLKEHHPDSAEPFTYHSRLPVRRIDHVLSSPGLLLSSQQVRRFRLSDHMPLVVEARFGGM